MIRKASLDRQCRLERPVLAAKVLVHEMQGERAVQVRGLLGEGVGQPREAAQRQRIVRFRRSTWDVET